MWHEVLLISLVGGIVAVDTTAAWQVMICRPVVCGPLVGFLLGDVQTGLLFGGLMELVWAGILPAGAAVFPDGNVAVVVATGVAIALRQYAVPTSFALLIAFLYMMLVAYLGGILIVLMRKRNAVLLQRALDYAEKGLDRKIALQNWLGVCNAFLRGLLFSGVMSIIAAMVFTRNMLSFLPVNMEALDGTRVVISALGVAVMLTIFGSKKLLPYVLAGLAAGIMFTIL